MDSPLFRWMLSPVAAVGLLIPTATIAPHGSGLMRAQGAPLERAAARLCRQMTSALFVLICCGARGGAGLSLPSTPRWFRVCTVLAKVAATNGVPKGQRCVLPGGRNEEPTQSTALPAVWSGRRCPGVGQALEPLPLSRDSSLPTAREIRAPWAQFQ